MLKSIVMVMCGILCAACSSLEKSAPAGRPSGNINSTLWMQSSSEFRASSFQIYNAATRNLVAAVKTTVGTAAIEQTGDYRSLPPAVILDIDETVLDNSKYHAKLILEGNEYSSESWDQWLALKQATLIPGAADFVNDAESMGVEVIYITNRTCQARKDSIAECPQEDDTIENLERVGISGVRPSRMLLRKEQDDWLSDKASRRKLVADKYRIVMLIGDDLGDFIANVKKNITPQRRALLVSKHKEKWGQAWFILPNPKYGSWLHILEKPASKYLRSYTAKF